VARAVAAKIVLYRFSKLQITQEEFQAGYKPLIQGGRRELPENLQPAIPPHSGHPAGRVELGAGFLKNSEFFQLGWRPAYHDWDDPPPGYPDRGTLRFLDIKARYFLEPSALKLQSVELIGAGSLSPDNPVTKQTAWSLGTGISQTYLRDDREHLLFYAGGGAGKSYRVLHHGIFYWLLKGSMLAGPGLDNKVDIGPEVEIGFSRSLGPSWQINVSGKTAYYGIGEKRFFEHANVGLLKFISVRNAVSLNAGWTGIGGGRGIPEFLIRWQHYF
jgi:hypothetical protein